MITIRFDVTLDENEWADTRRELAGPDGHVEMPHDLIASIADAIATAAYRPDGGELTITLLDAPTPAGGNGGAS